MDNGKLKSFTLSEMLVVLVITAIVVGLAFTMLNLVRRQIHSIQRNMERTQVLSLFEQRIGQDFNSHNIISYEDNFITLVSDNDTVRYALKETFLVRNADTIRTSLKVDKIFYTGNEVKSGTIDAILFSAESVIHDYYIFVSSGPDATLKMNYDGI